MTELTEIEMMNFQTESLVFIVRMVEVKKGENVMRLIAHMQQLNNRTKNSVTIQVIRAQY